MKAAPRYSQIISYYRSLIESGKLAEGDKMPTEETIGETFGVSRITVRQALDGLAQSGYIYKIQGKGSFVEAKKAGMQLNHLIGFSDEMRSIGMEPSTSLISQSLEFPSEPVANALELDGTQKVYIISRLRCADAVPMAVETVCLPFARFAGIETYDMSKSLYTLFRQRYGCEPAKAIQSIQSGLAKAKEAKQLQIKAGAPVLRITRTAYDGAGVPFEYTESVYRGDKYVFNVTLEK